MRELSRKHNVSVAGISKKCKAEGWKQVSKQIVDRSEQKLVENISNEMSDISTVMYKAMTMAAEKIMRGMELIPDDDTTRVKQYTSALKDLQQMGLFKSDLDKQEQMARIEKLRKEAEKEETDNTIVVEFKGDIDEYSN